jgi:DNA-binding PadR family transcriptional regulator
MKDWTMTERPRRGRQRRSIGERGEWHRGRMRRGDIRTALLAALAEGPGHGYDVMQKLEEKTGGAWRPSPGSVYPTLQLLEDEGLVRSYERDGKRVYEITDAGREESQRRIEDAGGTPWELAGHGVRNAGELRMAVAQFHVTRPARWDRSRFRARRRRREAPRDRANASRTLRADGSER